MKREWKVLAIFCALALGGCAGLDGPGSSGGARPAPPEKALACAGGQEREAQRLELRKCLARLEGATLTCSGDCVTITLCCDNLFEPGSAVIGPALCGGLDAISEVAKKNSETSVRVDAHTDSMRSEEENLELSESQARAVGEALVRRGVHPDRVRAGGWGEAKPIASNATEEGRRANRRVTITLVPDRS